VVLPLLVDGLPLQRKESSGGNELLDAICKWLRNNSNGSRGKDFVKISAVCNAVGIYSRSMTLS
jgi:hypothetical protein